ncbi:response regulator [Marinicella litoralis]|uniref:histidine kinase n=1 Tax=Marinicella litoralis TaxID=644220 RepID=A0A4R6XUJ0_9GAMM|nr:response regulator [Marinicella litoralis]TDR23675.1 signal transduction histidine kinase [Marinicella litoralis]
MKKFKSLHSLCLVLILSVAASSDFDEVGLPLITHFNQEDYKAHHANWDIHQANNGLIYIANGNGILVFDGEEFTHHYSPNKTGVRDIDLVGDKVYLGTLNNIGFFQPAANGVLVYQSLNPYLAPENLPFGEIYSVVAFADKVVFKAMAYYFIWDGETLTTVPDDSNSYTKTIPVNDRLYTKLLNDEHVYELDFNSEKLLKDTPWRLPLKSQVKGIELNAENELIFFTAHHGIYKQHGDELLKVQDQLNEPVFIYDVTKSKKGLFYVATINGGLFILSNDLEVLKNYKDIHGLKISQVSGVLQDQQNNIWTVGYNGLNVMRPPDEISTFAKANNMYAFGFADIQGEPSFLGKRVLQLHADEENPLYPPSFQPIGEIEGVRDSLDFQDRTFLCTNNGLYLIKVENHRITEKQLVFDESKYIFDIAISDDSKHVFVSTNLGVYQIQEISNEWHSEAIQGLAFELNNIEVENNKALWVGSRTGELFRLALDGINTPTQSLMKFTEKDGLSTDLVIPFKLSSGLVFGTRDGTMRYFEEDNKLLLDERLPDILRRQNMAVEMLYEDQNQYIWYTTDEQQGYINKTANKWQHNTVLFNYFPPRFNRNYLSVKDHILWFMQTGGDIFRMDVNATKKLPDVAPLYIRELINSNTGNTIQAGVVTDIKTPIDFSSNSIRIKYALADYATPHRAMYRTKLNGTQNSQWSAWSNETYKDFTELRGKDYRLEVQAKDVFGRITPSTDLAFTVLPPVYLSKTALVAYVVLGLLFLWLATWAVIKSRTKKLKMENQRLDELVKNKTQFLHSKAMDLELLHKAKDRFMTDFSHELRTPLSLIMAPIEQVKSKQPHHMLDVAMKNAEKLRGQINRIFDLQHLNDPVIKLKQTHLDLVVITAQVVDEFQAWATKHQQTLTFECPTQSHMTLFDKEKIQAVLSNLISNAIKYSGVGSHIWVDIESKGSTIQVNVIDDGPGISLAKKDQVFERFVTDDSLNTSQIPGVGVGLAYAKEIIASHDGQLCLVESIKGAHFQFEIPLISQPEEITWINSNEQVVTKDSDDHPVLMVVEDNEELREVLVKILSEAFVVYEFSSADAALQQVENVLPDAIISDVMMPGTDGVAFTRILRKIKTLQTTPVILLTAKVAQKDIQQGLEAGATDYMVKPFSPRELFLRVSNHIQAVHAIREQLQPANNQVEARSPFLAELNKVILATIREGRLSTEQLAMKMAMDRTTLFRKIKKAADCPPSQYLIQFRLNIAKSLLEQQQNSISEVAYACGFESLSYFSTCFKKHFHVTPSQYIDAAVSS